MTSTKRLVNIFFTAQYGFHGHDYFYAVLEIGQESDLAKAGMETFFATNTNKNSHDHEIHIEISFLIQPWRFFMMSEKFSLTPVELELMEILWKLGRGTVRNVMANLSQNRQLAYTSVSTMLRILQQKKIVTAKKEGKHHIYIPALSKETFAAYSVKKIVNQVFSGNSVELVAYLVDKHDISIEDMKAIQHLLNAKKKEIS